jgi:serine/threonine-protein kinase HipA
MEPHHKIWLNMTQRSAEILFKDRPAGILEETATGGTRFTYSADWNTPIACSLPVTRREHEWPQGVHPFFQHLGPEGWLRQQQAHVAHVQEQDDFGILLRFGGDCIGAVSVRSKPGAADGLPPVNEITANPGRTVSGVQRKLLVVKEGNHFAPAAETGPAPYIAKFNSDRIDSLVRNEALSLRWSAAVLEGDEINSYTLGQVSKINETALVVTRFDRTPAGAKLRLEDFAQILVKPRGADFSGKYNAAYEDVAAAIAKHSARPAIDLRKFFRRLVVFVLVGNCDAHLKNFSLLETPQGLRLSPAYDILNTAIYDGFDQNIALSINGKKQALDEITWPLLASFGQSIGLPQAAIDQTRTNLRARVRKAASILEPPAAEPPDGFVHRYSDIVRRACQRIVEE